jgi:hypothetical protein
VHGWDVARAIGVPFEADPADLVLAEGLLQQFTAGGPNEAFGAVVTVEDGSALDVVIGLSGRDPGWSRPS